MRAKCVLVGKPAGDIRIVAGYLRLSSFVAKVGLFRGCWRVSGMQKVLGSSPLWTDLGACPSLVTQTPKRQRSVP